MCVCARVDASCRDVREYDRYLPVRPMWQMRIHKQLRLRAEEEIIHAPLEALSVRIEKSAAPRGIK